MRLHACVVALFAAVCAAAPLAQRPAPVPPGTADGEPTFRSRVDLAQVDVLVTDASGEPVAGLTAADFALFENGVPRPITAFEAVHLANDGNDDRIDTVERGSDVSANSEPPGRIYVFTLDVVAACDALRARHFLREFLDRHFGPRDMASVALVGPGLATDGQDFTGNRRLLLDAIDKYSGGFARACERRYTPPRPLSAGRSQQMASLRTLTESLALIPGRKTVLLFTQSLDVDMLDVVDTGRQPGRRRSNHSSSPQKCWMPTGRTFAWSCRNEL
jgi:VWFA-related protein